MDVFDLASKLGNLGVGGLAFYMLLEFREQRREARRNKSDTDEKLVGLATNVAVLVDRVSRDPAAPAAIPSPLPHVRSRPHHAPAFGVEVTRNERPSKRMRSVSDPPDDDDER